MSASAPQAVFLSYAHEDTDAAHRIADALRGFGIEVWFDQSELRGGDAWDQKIRSQIKDCALFVPVISTHTEARGEGYFRLEWNLADERTRLMAKGVPFLLPVVVDATADGDAMVPDSFRAVQWTRLPGGAPTPQFVDQVKRLLESPRKSAAAKKSAAASQSPETPAAAKRGFPMGMVGALGAAVIVVIAFIVFRPTAKETPVARPKPAAETKAAPAAPVISEKSIAVIPFENRSAEKDSAYFTDGIHDDILTSLTNLHELHVISRTSVMEYRGTTKKIPQIARELGVAYVLEGGVQRVGNSVHITGQLIRAATDEHIWAKSFDRELTATNLFAIQSELAQAIAGELKAALSPQERSLLERRPTENLAAYDLYLKASTASHAASFLAEGGDVALLRQRENLLLQAVELDPKFVEAWGFLAEIHGDFYSGNMDRTEARLAKAKAAIDRIVSLAPDSPSVLWSVASYYIAFYQDYARATEQLDKLARLQPNDSSVYTFLGQVRHWQGRWPEAIASLRKATQLEPRHIGAASALVQVLRQCRRFDDAIAELRRIVAMRPERLRDEITLASLVDAASGSTRETDQLIARLSAQNPDSPRLIAIRKRVARERGDFAEFVRLDRLQPFSADDGDEFSQVLGATMAYRAMGDRAAARARLEGFPAKLRLLLEEQPTNAAYWGNLGLMEALLEHNDEAVRCARKAVELWPESRDADRGPLRSYNLAVVYAWTGDKDRAIAELTRLLRIPSILSGRALRTEMRWTPLRGDPRFEALAADPKNDAPLF